MSSFLGQVIDFIKSENKNDFSDITIVFPSRRAGVIFRKKFALSNSKPVFSPRVFSIKDFLISLSPYRIPERIELLLELYEVYRHHYNETSFEKFSPWGEMMLKDFDQVDRHLVDAGLLFSSVKEIKEIENVFQPGSEEAELFMGFWKNFSDEPYTQVKTNFLQHWIILSKIYVAYRQSLIKKNMAYEGLALRLITESLDSIPKVNDKIIFAGFNALSKAEQVLIRHFKDVHQAVLLWDMDSYYADDFFQEAGTYFRKNIFEETEVKWKGDYFKNSKKNVISYGIPLQEGQAKFLGSKLKSLLRENKLNPEDTVIVLPDEKLLFPVLYALPEEIKSINVTMGFPLVNSQAGQLINLLIRLHNPVSAMEDSPSAYVVDEVIELIENPWLYAGNSQSGYQFLKELRSMRSRYISKDLIHKKMEELTGFPWLSSFSGFHDVLDYFLRVFNFINSNADEKDLLSGFQKQIISFVIGKIKSLYEIIQPWSDKLTVDSAWPIIKDYLLSSKIPFSGEPVHGLQIMGFLETRALDFKNVFVLSVNEGVLPPSSKENSYIPYSVRKSFGLPVYDEADAVSSYHFYRLLQRAENIYLVYNTEVNSFSGGEKSRFLLQLEHELISKAPGSEFKSIAVNTPIPDNTIYPVIIEKNEEVMQMLNRFYVSEKNEKQRKFSASSLSTYINCSLQFFFRHVAGIKTTDEVTEDMDDATFGKVFHHAMQDLYLDFPLINASDFILIEKKVEQSVDIAIREELETDSVEGKNSLLREIIIDLIKKVIRLDQLQVPIQIAALEKEMEISLKLSNDKSVIIKGIIDRLEIPAVNFFKIVDYKTGKAEIKRKFTVENALEPESKIPFQLLLYSWMQDRSEPGKNIIACIYPLTKINRGAQYIFDGNPVSPEQFSGFENKLIQLVEEIVDTSKPFLQTDDRKRCEFCDFKTICNR